MQEQKGREFALSLGADIQNFQVIRLKARWNRISPVLYVGQRLNRLEKSGQAIIKDYLIMRGVAIGKNVAPNDQNAADNTCGDFLTGALFMDEAMNTVSQFNHRMDTRELKKLSAIKDHYPRGEDPLVEMTGFIAYVSPNLKALMNDVVDKFTEDRKLTVATGLIEMYALKIMRSSVLRTLVTGLSIPDSFRELMQEIDLEGI